MLETSPEEVRERLDNRSSSIAELYDKDRRTAARPVGPHGFLLEGEKEH